MGADAVLARRRATGKSQMWSWILGKVLRPLLSVVLSAGALLALAIPALSIHTVTPGTVGIPGRLPIMQTYDQIEAAFPGAPIPAVVLITAKDVTGPAVVSGVATLRKAVKAKPEKLCGPTVEMISADRTVAILTVSLAGSGTDAQSERALAPLRDQSFPPRSAGWPAYRPTSLEPLPRRSTSTTP